MRIKYRYLVYEVMLDGDFQTAKFSSDDLRRAAISSIETAYGIMGMAHMMPGLLVLWWHPELRVVVFRCLRDYSDQFCLALALSMRSPNDQDWSFRQLKICSRIPACRETIERQIQLWEEKLIKRGGTAQAKNAMISNKREMVSMLDELT